MFVILVLFLSILLFLTVSSTPFVPKPPYYAKFETDGSISFNPVAHERVDNWASMVKEAHSKYKFKPGIVYYSLWDTAETEGAADQTYFQVSLKSQYDYFKNFLGPDWTCISFPQALVTDYSTTTYFIADSSSQPPKYQKVGWFGNVKSPLAFRVEAKTRPLLLEYAANYSHMFDFRHVGEGSSVPHLPLTDLVKDYAYLLDIGGNGYSGRLKYLLWSNRPLLYVERDYVEYFNEHLKPYEHYIPVKQDLSDLVSQTEWILKNPDKASEIAQNAQDFAIEYLNHDAFIDRVTDVVNYLLDHS